jgi:oxygen-independent coproporphyrinogen-3 oxidase
MRYLPKQKFAQYEVSNFAKKGFECKHNLGYWDNNPYIGLGPSAAFYQDGTRGQNISDVTKYIQGVKSAKSVIASREKLTPLQRAKEAAAIKIRTAQGINFKKFKERTGYDFMTLQSQPMADLIVDKYVKLKASRGQKTGVYLTKRGFLFCDTVSSSLL